MNALTKTAIKPLAGDENRADLTIADTQQIVATWSVLPPHRAQKMRTALVSLESARVQMRVAD
jgi:hypothetical protein